MFKMIVIIGFHCSFLGQQWHISISAGNRDRARDYANPKLKSDKSCNHDHDHDDYSWHTMWCHDKIVHDVQE